MPDNPAVRAVAAGISGEQHPEHGFTVFGSKQRVATEALAALASSQEVREWLYDVVTPVITHAQLRHEAVERILNALGGGEG